MLLDTPVCDFGSAAPDFRLRTPQGVEYTRDSLMGEKGMLIAFICNHCPYVIAIIDRLAEDLRRLEDLGIGAACIMSNDWSTHPADSPENMIRFADQHRLTPPYLVDGDQSVAREYGAVCTPDFFGHNADGGLQYRGRLDDALRGDPSSRVPEMVQAMTQVAQTGQGPAAQTPSMGCSIKWR